MKKPLTIALVAAISLAAHGCSQSHPPSAQAQKSTQPTAPTTPAPSQQSESVASSTSQSTTERNPEKSTIAKVAQAPAAPSVATPVSESKQSSVIGSRQDRSWEAQGMAATGEAVSLSLDSIQVAQRSLGMAQPPTYFFQYRIGGERIYAVTACNGQFSTSQDGDRYDDPIQPQSDATQRMLDRVCRFRVKTAQVVSAPTLSAPTLSAPTHVRMGVDGEIICTIQTQQTINTYGQSDGWVYTDACGRLGMIHSSQIR